MELDGQLISELGVKKYLKGLSAQSYTNINPLQRQSTANKKWEECNFGCHGPKYRVMTRELSYQEILSQVDKLSPLVAGGIDGVKHELLTKPHASLFPDLIGAADYCNIFMAEIERNRQLHKIDFSAPSYIGKGGLTLGGAVSTKLIASPQEQNATSIIELLKSTPESKEVEPSRITLIADELNRYLSKSMVVDWQERQTVQAEMRNVTRVLLRKYGYPVNARDKVVEKILEVVGGGSGE